MSRRQNHQTFRRAAAPAPAAAGHRPLLLAVALATGFSALPACAQQAIVGTATVSKQGNTTVVTTTNGAGTGFSSINWQSFNVPAGSNTHFAQPGVTSTSINRVLGPDPSAIYGTLSSNGRLVLVNPAGITVGAGAVVDTAAFTASTLRMGDADALAGRMRFADGSGAGLKVDGQVLARSGDVVLIGQNVETGAQALIRSPQGATVLAAGQKVEVTGRGLEGIVFEVQAPADQAVNLGTLSGDAVGVFAGTLRHSGLIQAQAVSTEGGKVVLRAADTALAAGTIRAQGHNGAGGSVDVLGDKVGVLAGATIDTSDTAGGGRIRIGGDYQGQSAGAPNARVAYLAADAQLRANATDAGNGGTVIVWADDTTRAYGRIEARGGANGGNGGLVETSGKRYLDANGVRVDASATQGAAGTWLLDPSDIYIVGATPAPTLPPTDLGNGPNFAAAANSSGSTLDAGVLNAAIDGGTNVSVVTASGTGTGNGDIIFSSANGPINLARSTAGTRTLTLQAGRNIVFESGSSTSIQTTGGSGRNLNVNLQASGGIVTDSGATVALSTDDASSNVQLKVAAGKTWTNNGMLTLNQNGLVSMDGATFVNNGYVTGSAGTTGGFGGTAGNGTFQNNGTVSLSQGVFQVGTLIQTPAPTPSPTASPAPSPAPEAQFALYGNARMRVSQNFAVTGGAFYFQGSDLTLTQASGDLNVGIGTGAAILASGAVQMTASKGNLNVAPDIRARSASLQAAGTVGFANIGTYGDGTIGTAGGAVTIVGSLGVSGGGIDASGYDIGNGGAVSVQSGGAISLNSLYSYGGSTFGGKGGNGGSVSVASTGGTVDVSYVDVTGGGGSLSAGGSGGAVTLSGSSVTATSVQAYGGGGDGQRGGDGGSIALSAGSGGVIVQSGLNASGGHASGSSTPNAGGQGGRGGSIALNAAGGNIDVRGVYLDASGGSGGSGSSLGGAGGAGGSVTLTASAGAVLASTYVPMTASSRTFIGAVGGWGGDTSGQAATDRGGAGGAGGRVTITAGNGSQLLGSVAADGGGGGYAGAAGGSATGGSGGAGGSVAFNVSGTAQLGGDASAAGGVGGGAYDANVADDPTRRGASGATGSVTTGGGTYTIAQGYALPVTGTTATTSGSFNVSGTWTNNATVVLQPFAWVMAGHAITNNGTMDLGGGSVLSMGAHDSSRGGFTPGGGRFTNAAGAVLQGRGTLEGSVTNAGTLKVGDSATDPGYPIGTFTILGDLVQQSSGTLAFDIAANTPFQAGATYDQLQVSGAATLGGTLQVNQLAQVTVPAPTPAPTPLPTQPPVLALALAAALPTTTTSTSTSTTPASFTAGGITGTYVLLDVPGGSTGSFSTYNGPAGVVSLLQMSNGSSLGPIPGAVLPPAPPPPVPQVLASDPLVDKIVGMLGGSASRETVQGALSEQDTLVTKFLDKLLDEEQKQKDAAKGEIVYTDTACKPS